MGRKYGIVTGMSQMGKSYLIENYIIPKLLQDKPVIALDPHGEFEGIQHASFQDFIRHVREKEMITREPHIIPWQSDNDGVNTVRFIRFIEEEIALVIDEAHMIFEDPKLKKTLRKPIRELTMYGSHHGIDTILCTQRPSNLSANVRSQAQFTVFFRLNDRADLAYAREKGPEVAEAVANLQKTEFFTCGPDVPNDFDKLKLNEVNSL